MDWKKVLADVKGKTLLEAAEPPEAAEAAARALGFFFVRVDGGSVPDGAALLFLGTHNAQIPVAVKPLQPASEGVSHRAKPAGTETILLVDDDIGARALARDALEAKGYTVLDAGVDPRQAVRIAKEHNGPIHMLITDIVMPLMNGFHLIERVLPLRPSIKVVLMSAYSVSGTFSRSDRYLPKPFTVEDLCRAVRDTLDGRSPFAPPRPPTPRP